MNQRSHTFSILRGSSPSIFFSLYFVEIHSSKMCEFKNENIIFAFPFSILRSCGVIAFFFVICVLPYPSISHGGRGRNHTYIMRHNECNTFIESRWIFCPVYWLENGKYSITRDSCD